MEVWGSGGITNGPEGHSKSIGSTKIAQGSRLLRLGLVFGMFACLHSLFGSLGLSDMIMIPSRCMYTRDGVEERLAVLLWKRNECVFGKAIS